MRGRAEGRVVHLRYVPKNHISRAIGRLVHARLPRPISHRTRSTSTQPASRCTTLPRSATSSAISPSRRWRTANFGVIANGRIEQVKGKTYTLARFLADETNATRYENGAFFNFYLSPQDYHHVHSPVGGGIVRSVHIPGKLWPVNDWSLANIDELFSINERVVTYVDSDLGRVAVVMIGATNVGKISVTYDSFISNSADVDRTVARDYIPTIPVTAGSRLDTFHMGSSVVVLLEPRRVDFARVRLEAGKKVQCGAAILGNEKLPD